jgi:hypothetical protein
MIHDPRINVDCDNCGYGVNFSLTVTSKGWGMHDLHDTLKKRWMESA